MVTAAGPFLTEDWLPVLVSVPEPRLPVSLTACGICQMPESRQGQKAQGTPSLGGTTEARALAMSSLECVAPDVT